MSLATLQMKFQILVSVIMKINQISSSYANSLGKTQQVDVLIPNYFYLSYCLKNSKILFLFNCYRTSGVILKKIILVFYSLVLLSNFEIFFKISNHEMKISIFSDNLYLLLSNYQFNF